MKLGILGTGQIVKDMLQGIHELDLEKIYILGTEQTREETEGLKEKYNLNKTFYDYDELLASDIDTVYVALPNMLHFSFSKKALEHDKNVIVEKPACANMGELYDLIKIAVTKSLLFFEASLVFYFPMIKSLLEDVKKIGEIQIVSLNFSQYSSRYDKFKQGEILPVFDPECAGGALMDLNIYNINFLFALFGKPDSYSYHANITHGIDTSGIFIADYPTFKACCVAAKSCKAPTYVCIEGDEGTILSYNSMNKAHSYEVHLKDGETIKREFNQDNHHRMYYEFKTFIDAINNKDYKLNLRALEFMYDVSEVMTEARIKAGIEFPNDKKLIRESLFGKVD